MSGQDGFEKQSGKGEALPRGQFAIKRLLRWGKDHPAIGVSVPEINLEKWVLVIDGEFSKPLNLDWNEVMELPRTESVSNLHCVEGWTLLDLMWEGVQFMTIVGLVEPNENVEFVISNVLMDTPLLFPLRSSLDKISY